MAADSPRLLVKSSDHVATVGQTVAPFSPLC